ncbi:hypothetical protein QDA09_gp61 [Microbacterium phage Tyrumbra]|uniref:Uncharacterized protein n=1 Tax=Microbacterium phage Tyrumbra TaxID=2596974 RepID=A0A516KPK7_9CAUD|nr:hypothetical protein QDA09_gp61 [Microbacterium phage Tyrumbra]QDP43598.1 hypothetical protein SEA_TYRUMBRA_61 [Microbacterium phage Tyrumbra]
MKISIKTSQGGGMFGGGPSSEVSIEGQDYEVPQAVTATQFILAQSGIGEFPSVPDDETTVTEPDEDTPEDGYTESDDVPAAGWRDDKGDPLQRVSNPGDAVHIVWPDRTSRVFIDDGHEWIAPAVSGRFAGPGVVQFDDPEVTVYLAASQPEPGVPFEPLTGNQE